MKPPRSFDQTTGGRQGDKAIDPMHKPGDADQFQPEKPDGREPRGAAILVVTRWEENAEAINSILRNRGLASHCTRVADLTGIESQLRDDFGVAIVFSDENADVLSELLRLRDSIRADLPVISCRDAIDSDVLSADVIAGAADLITLSQRQRLFKVMERELERSSIRQTLRETIAASDGYKEQLKTLLAGSTDAIIYVQEGIVLECNPAAIQVFGYDDETSLVNTPIMDHFAGESQAALKGALVACVQDKWPNEPLKSTGLDQYGSKLALVLNIELSQFENEPCVRVAISTGSQTDGVMASELHQAINNDPTTGLYARQFFLDHLMLELARPLKGGMRALALLRPDAFGGVVDTVGPLASENILTALAKLLSDHVQDSDIYGRFGGTTFAILLARGNHRDLRAWGKDLCRHTAEHVFECGSHSISLTCTIGLSVVEGKPDDPEPLIAEAMDACRRGRAEGGDRVMLTATDAATTAMEEVDELWVPRIKQALIDDRFRLAQQPVAGLAGEDPGFVDILVRMIDEQGDEVLPGEFLAAAERNKLIKNIDRWVIGAALAWCSKTDIKKAFVRLSGASVTDETLFDWIVTQLECNGLAADRIVFQVDEKTAAQQLRPVRGLAEKLRSYGFGFAIEHFGIGPRPAQILSHVSMDFVKIDGSLMQGLARDVHLQATVGDLVTQAKDSGIRTIAERVEDANTMATLWQLGIEFIQGYQVQEPEVVLSEEPDEKITH